jgi:hypothetical protein
MIISRSAQTSSRYASASTGSADERTLRSARRRSFHRSGQAAGLSKRSASSRVTG